MKTLIFTILGLFFFQGYNLAQIRDKDTYSKNAIRQTMVMLAITGTEAPKKITQEHHTEIYPNPVHKGDFIYIKSLDKIESVEIYDLTGNMIALYTPESGEEGLAIQSLSFRSGVYFFKVKTEGNHTITQRIIVI
ncbi:MAG: T9SS type A sorting domain-containing protein [Cytophagaceae bacterium]|nr:T9SS type A sorting domain-containing protein [Cytophagaceae bacterium]